jgi:hypothetical protein
VKGWSRSERSDERQLCRARSPPPTLQAGLYRTRDRWPSRENTRRREAASTWRRRLVHLLTSSPLLRPSLCCKPRCRRAALASRIHLRASSHPSHLGRRGLERPCEHRSFAHDVRGEARPIFRQRAGGSAQRLHRPAHRRLPGPRRRHQEVPARDVQSVGPTASARLGRQGDEGTIEMSPALKQKRRTEIGKSFIRAGSSWAALSASTENVPFNDAVPFAEEWR